VENEAEVVEQDIIDILAAQGEVVDDNDEEYEVADELPEDADALKALLLRERDIKSKRNKSLKKSKEATHRMQEEIKALQRQAEESRSTTQAPDVEAQRLLRNEADEKLRDSVNDDPGSVVDLLNDRVGSLQDNVVNVVTSMQAEFDKQIAELKGEMSPQKIKYRDKINQLKANPKFASLSDDVLLTIVEGMSDVRVPRGGQISGRKATVTVDPEQGKKDAREKYAKFFENGH
jgi:hypothetical protein